MNLPIQVRFDESFSIASTSECGIERDPSSETRLSLVSRDNFFQSCPEEGIEAAQTWDELLSLKVAQKRRYLLVNRL